MVSVCLEDAMKNPLESLEKTIVLGLILTVILVYIVKAMA